MSRPTCALVWFNRLLLAAATFIMTMIAVRTLWDPVAATRPMGIVLNSPTAITVARVGFGGFPLGLAVALLGSLISTERLLSGLYLLLAVMGAATIARIQGIVLDGPTPYNLGLLRPEILLCVLSVVGIALGHGRRHGDASGADHRASLQPSTAAGGER
jgi:Domain of unknown function (DUF4345)